MKVNIFLSQTISPTLSVTVTLLFKQRIASCSIPEEDAILKANAGQRSVILDKEKEQESHTELGFFLKSSFIF